MRAVHRLAQRRALGGDGDDGGAAPVGLLGEDGEAGLGSVGGGDEQQVDGSGPAGQGPAQRPGGVRDAGRVQADDGRGGPGERSEQVRDPGGGGAGPGDEDGAGAAVGAQVSETGLGGVPGRGAHPCSGVRGAAEEAAAVGARKIVRCVEERLVEHGGLRLFG